MTCSPRRDLIEPELRQEPALVLFQQDRLTLAQSARLAGLSRLAFQKLLADRQIPIRYGVEEFREDVDDRTKRG
jgi:predicted HTH domain antitoxin